MKKSVLVTTLILVAIMLSGGIAVLCFSGKPLKVKTDTELEGVSEEIRNVLYYAAFAANSHNTQGWRIEINTDKQQLTIFLDEERTLEVVDPQCRELYLSLGCYIETMTSSFDAYGYDTTVEYAEALGTDNEIATISYRQREDAEISPGQLETIKRRHTDKSCYSTEKLDPVVVAELLQDDSEIYCYETDSKEFEYLKNGTLEAITEQSAQASYREELNLWMRFSDREVEQKKDGISAEMIGLKGIVKTFYYLTTNHENAEKDAFANQGIDTAKKQLENCSGFFVITGNDTISEWIETGRKTQAFWYKCTENNIAVQPLSAMLEVAPYNQEIQDRLGVSKNVQMILRVGYVKDYGENAGVRRNLNEYITVTDSN